MDNVDLKALQRTLAGASTPPGHDRIERVRLLGAAARRLLEWGTPEGLYLGGALAAWLERGGNLERDYLRVTKPKSHITPMRLWRELRHHDERQEECIGPSVAPRGDTKGAKP
jgi:hypothetical protein